jgi:hypothetical protein
MTHPARHISMRTAQRERGTGLMVEQRGLPPAGGVTAGAVYGVIAGAELAFVNVLVTALALERSRLEGQLAIGQLTRNRPMTSLASQRGVPAGKRESSLSVVEGLQLLPAS